MESLNNSKVLVESRQVPKEFLAIKFPTGQYRSLSLTHNHWDKQDLFLSSSESEIVETSYFNFFPLHVCKVKTLLALPFILMGQL